MCLFASERSWEEFLKTLEVVFRTQFSELNALQYSGKNGGEH